MGLIQHPVHLRQVEQRVRIFVLGQALHRGRWKRGRLFTLRRACGGQPISLVYLKG